MAQPFWHFVLADVAGTTLADINLASSRQVSYQLNGASSCSFQLPLTSSNAAVVNPGSSYIKAYRTSAVTGLKTLQFYGPVWVAEEQGGGAGNGVDQLKVTAYDPLIYLGKRFTTATYAATPTDQGAILKALVDTTNSANETGIRTNAANIVASTTASPDWSTSKVDLLQIMQQFGDAFGGVDTALIPIELTGGKTCDLYVYNRRGGAKANAIFGYGSATVNNCFGMNRVRSMETVANDVLGFSDTVSSNVVNTTSINSYRRLYADISLTEVTDPTVMANRTKGYLDTHDTPTSVQQLTINAGNAAPRLFDDFNIGDTVRVEFSKGIAFDTSQRVWGCTVQIDDNGVETAATLDTRNA